MYLTQKHLEKIKETIVREVIQLNSKIATYTNEGEVDTIINRELNKIAGVTIVPYFNWEPLSFGTFGAGCVIESGNPFYDYVGFVNTYHRALIASADGMRNIKKYGAIEWVGISAKVVSNYAGVRIMESLRQYDFSWHITPPRIAPSSVAIFRTPSKDMPYRYGTSACQTRLIITNLEIDKCLSGYADF